MQWDSKKSKYDKATKWTILKRTKAVSLLYSFGESEGEGIKMKRIEVTE
jgi:hypothetical protein